MFVLVILLKMAPMFIFVPDFFEECIKEEQYEAKKLDILRDAVRAKATYNLASRSDSLPEEDGKTASSPRATSPEVALSPIHENGQENGHNGALKEEGVENGCGSQEEGVVNGVNGKAE